MAPNRSLFAAARSLEWFPVKRGRVPSFHAQSPRRRDQSVPAAACEQPGRLVPVGARCAGAGEAPRSPDLPVDRLRGVPLVPRHGARVVRGRSDGRGAEQPVRLGQGGPRGAAGPRPGLHGRGPVDDRQRRLADERVPDPRRPARSTAGPTSRTNRATGCRRSGRCWTVWTGPGASSATRSRTRARGSWPGWSKQQQLEAAPAEHAPTQALLDAATAGIAASFDAANGGWGGAPKFPQPMTIEYLLRRHVATGDERTLAIALRSLEAMADGGIHDQLGGGFHRYSTDARWLVPHFEQMLYDNAQLARVYTHAFALTGDGGGATSRPGRSTTCSGSSPRPTAPSPPARTPTPSTSRA